ncbi:MAG: hypothetical protein OZ948_15480 [Deltaproteobacteria bacterium]|nr:hypothetical protein [Deltaproteobacteria bacterium]
MLTRGELPERGAGREVTGRLVPIFEDGLYTRPPAIVPTCEALWACVLAEDRLVARLRDPWNRDVRRLGMVAVARDWQRSLDRGESLAEPLLAVAAP